MSEGARNFLVWLVLGTAAYAAYSYYSRPTDIGDAIRQKQVDLTISASDANNATFTISRPSGASGGLTVSIPVGTLIRNADRGSQRLMTARPAVVSFSGATTTMKTTVETYCVDQFALTPTLNSKLSLVTVVDGGTYTEETEPIRKLAICMAKNYHYHKASQFALWLVSGKLLDKSYSAVREELSSNYRRLIAQQLQQKVGEVRQRLRASVPDISEGEIDVAIANYQRTEQAGDIESEVSRRVADDLTGFVSSTKSILDGCGYRSADSLFFRTAS
jgi:hypothetical protein